MLNLNCVELRLKCNEQLQNLVILLLVVINIRMLTVSWITVLLCNQAPLCVEGWDEALHEIGRLSSETVLSTQNAESLVKAVEDMPVLIITGAEDALVSLKSSQAMASKFVNCVSIILLFPFFYYLPIAKSWDLTKLIVIMSWE